MNKEKSYLTYALGFITVILFIFGITLIAAIGLSIMGLTKLSLFGGAISLQTSLGDHSAWTTFLSLANGLIICLVLACLRQFFKNILAEDIFVAENVSLAKRVALLLFLAACLSDGVFEIGGYSFLNISFLVTALVVWTLSKILEKANQIAEENEFTI
ncbi:DUF2975 domain-containing protein [Streptococcus cuniculipharyngis]|uniref:DUF2975 domain-containing protein n=1 Tax=Streptococcus cuniculipharyngis TaxID=1562651 RepID=A0A5C5SC71_9STRE|nr:DUF2975 domain-containing protein [Streptococcus cuniculipharyngis]TWS98174.1 DUF2975 domain-containing protein [Streptococcus cuniculipharyngis]